MEEAIASLSNAENGILNAVNLNLQSSTLLANKANANGGALYIEDSTATIRLNKFSSDNAKLLGDEIYGKNAVINTLPTSSSTALAANLKMNNTFKNFDHQDFFFV